jgi:hypothetical protein
MTSAFATDSLLSPGGVALLGAILGSLLSAASGMEPLEHVRTVAPGMKPAVTTAPSRSATGTSR